MPKDNPKNPEGTKVNFLELPGFSEDLIHKIAEEYLMGNMHLNDFPEDMIHFGQVNKDLNAIVLQDEQAKQLLEDYRKEYFKRWFFVLMNFPDYIYDWKPEDESEHVVKVTMLMFMDFMEEAVEDKSLLLDYDKSFDNFYKNLREQRKLDAFKKVDDKALKSRIEAFQKQMGDIDKSLTDEGYAEKVNELLKRSPRIFYYIAFEESNSVYAEVQETDQSLRYPLESLVGPYLASQKDFYPAVSYIKRMKTPEERVNFFLSMSGLEILDRFFNSTEWSVELSPEVDRPIDRYLTIEEQCDLVKRMGLKRFFDWAGARPRGHGYSLHSAMAIVVKGFNNFSAEDWKDVDIKGLLSQMMIPPGYYQNERTPIVLDKFVNLMIQNPNVIGSKERVQKEIIDYDEVEKTVDILRAVKNDKARTALLTGRYVDPTVPIDERLIRGLIPKADLSLDEIQSDFSFQTLLMNDLSDEDRASVISLEYMNGRTYAEEILSRPMSPLVQLSVLDTIRKDPDKWKSTFVGDTTSLYSILSSILGLIGQIKFVENHDDIAQHIPEEELALLLDMGGFVIDEVAEYFHVSENNANTGPLFFQQNQGQAGDVREQVKQRLEVLVQFLIQDIFFEHKCFQFEETDLLTALVLPEDKDEFVLAPEPADEDDLSDSGYESFDSDDDDLSDFGADLSDDELTDEEIQEQQMVKEAGYLEKINIISMLHADCKLPIDHLTSTLGFKSHWRTYLMEFCSLPPVSDLALNKFKILPTPYLTATVEIIQDELAKHEGEKTSDIENMRNLQNVAQESLSELRTLGPTQQ